MKITGLVRTFNNVRARLQAGLAPEEIEPFKKHVLTLIRQVEDICRQHGATPQQLPGPSRMAYQFLRDLDLNNLPARAADAPVATSNRLKVKNVVSLGDHFAGRLWKDHAALRAQPALRDKLRADIGGHVESLDRLCARHGQTAAALETPTRQVYCWLRYLSEGDNLALHLEALERAALVVAANPSRMPVHLHLVNMTLYWNRRDYSNGHLLKVNEAFVHADTAVWQAIVRNALIRRDPGNDALIHEYEASDEFGETLLEIEAYAAAPVPPTRGHAHDLTESFARVNAAWFGGLMPQPALVWNRTLTARKFAHYQSSRDTVMISISLDDREVPAYVLDFVMYHELLHKKHGTARINGRRVSHSAAFRADERRYTRYDEAEAFLHALARRRLGLPPVAGNG
ncbi:MAG: hypothetical protein ACKV2V_08205 [Blastocatellia bacterium]